MEEQKTLASKLDEKEREYLRKEGFEGERLEALLRKEEAMSAGELDTLVRTIFSGGKLTDEEAMIANRRFIQRIEFRKSLRKLLDGTK